MFKILDISSLSNEDIIFLKANFEYIYKLRCESMISLHIQRGYSKEIAEKTVKGEHGCDIMSPDPIYQIDNIQFHTCPCNYRHPQMDFIMQATDAYDKGILPFEGSLIDQPSYIIEAINVIQSLKAQHQAEESKKNQGKKG